MISPAHLPSPAAVRTYRRGKAGAGALLALGALLTVGARQGPPPSPPAPLKSYSVASIREAMETSLPLGPLKGKRDAPRTVGEVTLAGRGPAGADASLTLDGKEIVAFTLGASGKWRAEVPVAAPGEREFHAVYTRDGADAGASQTYRALFASPEPPPKPIEPSRTPTADRNAEVETIRVTNLAPNNRVVLGRFALRGVAPPGDTLKVYMDATLLGRAEAKLSGRWEFVPKVQATGLHRFTVVDEITLRRFGPLPLLLVKPAVSTGHKPEPPPPTATSFLTPTPRSES